MDIINLTAMDMREKLKNKEISARDIVEAHIDRLQKMEEDLNAFITISKEEALNAADIIDEKIKKGEKLGPLAGIPIGVKDNIITKDIKTTCGSKMLENFIPPYESTVVEKIKKADGIILGKTNMDEFAMGSSTETSYFGITKNPIDTQRVPGGSSGGSAAAVRAKEVAIALGSDTGGSIRQPASFCGVVGLKPTYGLVSRYGLVSLANSLDQIGTLGRNVTDVALLLNAIVGYDEKDSTSVNMDIIDYIEGLSEDVKGMRIGVPKEYLNLNMDERVKEQILNSIEIFKNMGAVVEEISLPHIEYALATYYIISTAEISSNMARFDGIRYGYRAKDYETLDELYINSRSEAFGEEVKRRIMFGTYSLSKDNNEKIYKKAAKVRTIIKEDFDKIFEDYDIILSPTSPSLPFRIGERIEEPLAMYKSDIFTVPINLTGICAISIPCGYVEGLPVGLQIIGDKFEELKVLRLARAFEKHVSLGGENIGL
ncbi:aspartyl/glutamyl-tRNA(Asn/Gln) amidotransferase subunit A [Keratinibaculum paraultunense]|uniref:Glutamyl-tRNA(Gln) amidotransferase subunit A n=1 Tax=Keratinibaculum paraultunense TaxID=1278232 RepID=A0A4R3KZY6_9FIRM|nr:Asp-tRNA(Asn)/Glu-tRNA(Gln) amidotransferase subunit GatA [Keratinibaculum paraultunense]QQY80198.1 Asp-tRNA(Asn)/Glu-tRNA(Gln) amidotransferase subunit GatA [Keratinibaculum paraultunense]TCS90709.1 aspartyl/glutamyl-tRNA(Asn/Gln) amidotransferase subunit A [Keratinibaculum paraultunense]